MTTTNPIPRGKSVPRMLARWAALALVLLVLLTALYTWFVLSWSYSNGDRNGYVLKLSRKGWLCKTWEGEMQQVALPGAMPEKFAFTVRDDAVAAQINGHLGKLVNLHYEQHVGVPTSCFGDTMYYATGVTPTPPK